MYNINCISQGDDNKQHRVIELEIKELKEIYPSLPSELKYSVSLKKAEVGDRDGYHAKDTLWWIIDTEEDVGDGVEW